MIRQINISSSKVLKLNCLRLTHILIITVLVVNQLCKVQLLLALVEEHVRFTVTGDSSKNSQVIRCDQQSNGRATCDHQRL